MKSMKKPNQKVIDIAVSLIAAILVWIYVVTEVNPPVDTTVKNVPVQLINEEVLKSSGFALSNPSINYFVDVTVSGSRADIAEFSANKLTATADLFGLSSGPNQIIVKVNAPSGISVDKIESPKIELNVEEIVSHSKAVDLQIGDVQEGYEVTMFDPGSSRISVTGAQSIVAKVTKVYAKLDTSLLPLDKHTTLQLQLIPLDENGETVENVKLTPSYLEVSGTVYRLMDVSLLVPVEGAPGLNAEELQTEYPKKLTIKGPQDALNEIRSLTADTVNIEGITDVNTYKLNIELPEGVMFADSVGKLEAVITPYGNASFTEDISEQDIQVTGSSDDFTYEYSLPKTLSVDVSGQLSDIRNIKPEDLQAKLDLTSITESGEYEIELACAKDMTGVVTTYSTLTVNVKAEKLIETIQEDGSNL